MKGEVFLRLLQFSDGLFPAGSYAHSFGLETYVAAGAICDASGVESFLLSYLKGSVAPADAIAAVASRAAALSGNDALQKCMFVDRQLEAMKSAGELRMASRQMGRQVLRVATHMHAPFAQRELHAQLQNPLQPGLQTESLTELQTESRTESRTELRIELPKLTSDLFRAVQEEQTPGHHAVAFGVVGAAAGWPEFEMVCAYLYSACAGLAAAALRLLPLGQLEGQRVLAALAETIPQLAEEAQNKEMTDVWSCSFGIEIAAMRHATLDARLFRS